MVGAVPTYINTEPGYGIGTAVNQFFRVEVLFKIRLFHSFQTNQAVRRVKVSKPFLVSLGTCLWVAQHQSVRESSVIGVRCCISFLLNRMNQTSRANTQPKNRWWIISSSWEHRAQGLVVLKLI
jgi:hypothetical protein